MADAPTPTKKKAPLGIPTWGWVAVAGVIVAYVVFVKRAQSQQAAAAQAAQQQAYPVNVSYPPNNTGTAATAALLSLLGSGMGAPGVTKASQSTTVPSFFPVSSTQAKSILGGGGAVYYGTSNGNFVPITDLSQAPGTAQLYGTSMLSNVLPGQQLGTPV